ncbi:hypothetical protein FLB_05520 [Flavobacterium succinicans]|uniref:Uncharacterized protein n=1 Tax=Flavobacterium succinicans TaxID=29536 RepID=A0A199XST3_9FLAO|nr:hypothetical protein FLB_05520 [Flavobacterium succinicans]
MNSETKVVLGAVAVIGLLLLMGNKNSEPQKVVL